MVMHNSIFNSTKFLKMSHILRMQQHKLSSSLYAMSKKGDSYHVMETVAIDTKFLLAV